MYDYIDINKIFRFCLVDEDENQDDIINDIRNSIKKDDKYIIKKLINIKNNTNDDHTIQIVNKLIGDTKLGKKLRLTESAGFFNAVIFEAIPVPIPIKEYCKCSTIVRHGIYGAKLHPILMIRTNMPMINKNVKKKLNWIKNNFEIIPINFL